MQFFFRALARPDRREELLEFLKRDCEDSKQEKGTISFDVLEDPENGDAFYVYEAYEGEPVFDEHKQGAAFRTWEADIQPRLAAFTILFRGEPTYGIRKR